MKTNVFVPVVSLFGLTFFFLTGTRVFSDGTSDTSKAETAMTLSTDVESPRYSERIYFDLVRKFTVDGGEKVDYEAWKNSAEDLKLLDRQVAMIATISPVSHPALFPTRAMQRAYWINSYNTLILHAILEYWPLESVRDIKISISSRAVPGKGFFLRPQDRGGR